MAGVLTPVVRQAVALLATWTALVVPAWWVGGVVAVEGLTYAALLCFLPAGMLLVRAVVSPGAGPFADLVLGMGLRMALVLAGAWLIGTVRPDMTGRTFLYWLIPLYCVALVVETHWAVTVESVRGSVAQSPQGG